MLTLVLALWVVDRLISAARRPITSADPRDKARRRSTAGAAFALQQIFEPGTEHVVRTEQDEHSEDDDVSGDGDLDTAVEMLMADVRAALGRSPVDPEEVR